MRISRSALIGALATFVVTSASPAQAVTGLHITPGVLTSDQPLAGVQNVHDRRYTRHRHRHGHQSGFSFSFGFPLTTYQPHVYRPRYACPYGFRYDPYRHVCIGHPYGY